MLVSLFLSLRSGAKQEGVAASELPSFGKALIGAFPSLLLVVMVLAGILGRRVLTNGSLSHRRGLCVRALFLDLS